MQLYDRNYLLGLTPKENDEYQKILEREIVKINGVASIGRLNLFREYPKAARHYISLFPNNYLDIVELSDKEKLSQINIEFKNLIYTKSTKEQDILNYIYNQKAYHIIGSVLKGDRYCFGHHDAYLFREFQLGTSFKADFLIVGKGSGGYQFVFVELESIYGSSVLKDETLGGAFRKGINQVQEWNRWLQSNYSSLQEVFEKSKLQTVNLPKEFYKYDATRCHFFVVAGLRDDFKDKTYQIARESIDNNKISIRHYDNIIDYSENIIEQCTY